MGKIENSNKTGWIGNSSLHVADIVNDIAIIDTVDDCPNMEAKFDDAFVTEVEDAMIKFHLTKIMHPFGRCCQAVNPGKAKHQKLLKIQVKILMEKNLQMVQGWQMFLARPGTAHVFKMAEFSTYGIKIHTSSIWHKEKFGYQLYRIIMSESNTLEEDPKTQCHNYKDDSDYAKVRNKLFQNRLKILS